MTYQDCIWKGKIVWIVSIMSKNKRIHRYLTKYVGHGGQVIGTAKNNMLLIELSFRNKDHRIIRELRCIPASCVEQYINCKTAF